MIKWLLCVLVYGHEWEQVARFNAPPARGAKYVGDCYETQMSLLHGMVTTTYICKKCGAMHVTQTFGASK